MKNKNKELVFLNFYHLSPKFNHFQLRHCYALKNSQNYKKVSAVSTTSRKEDKNKTTTN